MKGAHPGQLTLLFLCMLAFPRCRSTFVAFVQLGTLVWIIFFVYSSLLLDRSHGGVDFCMSCFEMVLILVYSFSIIGRPLSHQGQFQSLMPAGKELDAMMGVGLNLINLSALVVLLCG